MRNIDWNNVQDAGNFARRPMPGGYIAEITAVQDVEAKQYLMVHIDIAAGEFNGYVRDYENDHGREPAFARTIRSYKPSAERFFKSFVTSVNKSNPGFYFANDPQSLVGKRVGVILDWDYYERDDGKTGKSLKISEFRSVQTILEQYPASANPVSVNPIDDEDDGELPF